MLSIKTLAPLPPQGRIIFVGDIHGCIDEFNHLLHESRFNAANDVLVLVGDLVNKGYDSIAVVKRAMQLNAHCVMGNHDAALIARYEHIQEGEINPEDPQYASDPMTKTAQTMPRECYKFLTSLPHILKVPQFDVVVVHAGLNPALPIDQQNLWELLHMRRVLPNGRVIDSQAGGDLWATKWRGPQTVIFGHDARTGFQQHKYAIGLDSGCCYGGELTAYILPSKAYVRVPGSRRGVSKKPPNASPATAIGYSPSVEPSVAIAQGQLPAGGGAYPANATAHGAGLSGRSPAQSLTDQLKSLLSVGKPSPSSSSPAPNAAAFPNAPTGMGASPTSAGPPSQPRRGPAANAGRATPPTMRPPVAPVSAAGPSPASAANANGNANGAAASPAAATKQRSPQAGPSAASAATSDAALLAHIVGTAAEMLAAAATGGGGETMGRFALRLLSGDAVEEQRESLIEGRAVAPAVWAKLLTGLVAYARAPQCGKADAQEALGWVQDVADMKPEALKGLDRAALSADLAAAPNASKAAVRSAQIALRG